MTNLPLLLLTMVSGLQSRYFDHVQQYQDTHQQNHHHPEHHCDKLEENLQQLGGALDHLHSYCHHVPAMLQCTIPTVQVLKQCSGVSLAQCSGDIHQRIKYSEHRRCFCGGLKKLQEMSDIVKMLTCPGSQRTGRGEGLHDFLSFLLPRALQDYHPDHTLYGHGDRAAECRCGVKKSTRIVGGTEVNPVS